MRISLYAYNHVVLRPVCNSLERSIAYTGRDLRTLVHHVPYDQRKAAI
jgi:hypothetical protein